MRTITKGAEPPSLTVHRQTAHCDYDNYQGKDDLRRVLLADQRGLCCYCMGRIHNGHAAMKIEHWRCQSRYPAEQLNYRNLLGTCIGGQSQPPNLQHCDTRKGERDLQWNPADPAHHIETRVRYEMDGSIRSDEPAFGAQLDEVLNLNIPVLMKNRQGVLDAILAWWKHEKEVRRGAVPRARFEQERHRRIDGTGHLEPFSQIAVWWLDQRLARMRA